MVGNEKEEKQKDEVLQQINDLLEAIDWGGRNDRMVLKLVFEGKFNLKVFCINGKEVDNA